MQQNVKAQNVYKEYDRTEIMAIQVDLSSTLYGTPLFINLESKISRMLSFNVNGGLTSTDLLYSIFIGTQNGLWDVGKEAKIGYHTGLSLRKYIGDSKVFNGVFYGPSIHYKEFNRVAENFCDNHDIKPILTDKRRVIDAGFEFGIVLSGNFLAELVFESGLRTHFIRDETCLVSQPFRVYLKETNSYRILPYLTIGIRVGFVLMKKHKK